jgi:hypothetical protein
VSCRLYAYLDTIDQAALGPDNRPEFIGFDDIDRLISVPTQMGFDLGVLIIITI